jgi:hypothetical protein
MAFVSDSRYRGFIAPDPAVDPAFDDPIVDILHDLVAGVTGFDGALVFPRWQTDPPNHPDITVDWAAVGVMTKTTDWQAFVRHRNIGEGIDELQRFEILTVLCTFYGPNAEKYAEMLRDGLHIWQNYSTLCSLGYGLVSLEDTVTAPELFRERWISRCDVNMILRREILRQYPVRSIVSAPGEITGNPLGDRRTVTDEFDTANIPAVTPHKIS